MNTFINQAFIITHAKKTWHFFYHANDGICFRYKTSETWTDYEILFREGMADFDVVLDNQSFIHLICRNKEGSIIYLVHKQEKWYKYVLLKSKSGAACPQNFKTIIVNNWINFFYRMTYKGQTLLIHHVPNHHHLPPTVVDVIADAAIPFSVCSNTVGDIILFYKHPSHSDKLGYKIYSWSKKQWGDFMVVKTDLLPPDSYHILIDTQDNTHLIQLIKKQNTYHIVYMQKRFDFTKHISWENQKTLFQNADKDAMPILLYVDKKWWVLWQQNKQIYSCFSKDNGSSWTIPTQLMSKNADNLYLFQYIHSSLSQAQNVMSLPCYGYDTGNDIILYVLSNYLSKHKPLAPRVHTQPQYLKQGHEIEEFANKHMHAFQKIDKQQDDVTKVETLSSEKKPINATQIEITKLKIAFNMLKEELTQLQKKVSTFNQIPETKEDFTPNTDVPFKKMVADLQNQNEKLIHRIDALQEIQNTLLHTKIQEINKEIVSLKRFFNRIDFKDLIEKTKSSEL